MKIANKRTTGLFLLFLIITPWLFIISFGIQKQVARYRMKEQLENQLLQSITIADDEIHWAEKAKEIWVNGKLFDIKNIEHHNDTTLFTGLYDEDETLLLKQFDETKNNNSSGNNQLLTQLFKCLHNSFYNHSPDPYFLSDKQHHFHNFTFLKLLYQFSAIPTPPPQA